ncbi:MAG: efflux RND transporter periplasmic adaptor subunit [Phycisphaerales bacterium]|nr:MAG: efflux RND transporter periplasmic adaptor subunit [Phycisphaerales bacterium]
MKERVGRPYRITQAVLTFFVLAVGIAILMLFLKFRKSPERAEQSLPAPLVQVRPLKAADVQMVVEGYGTVSPKVRVEIIPEVAGKVVFVHSELKAGGIIPAHEQIVQIDPRDYELAVRQAEAAVAEAQVRLDTETAEAAVARREWQQLHPETEPSSPLVLREPQIRQARATLESAKAQLATAELHLERTTISLPFDVLIASETVDLGQYIGIGQALASAFGIDAFEIEVPLEDRDLAWFNVFQGSTALASNTGQTDRVRARVHADFAGQEHVWTGHVTRTTGQVDPLSRMVPVVIEVPRPLDISEGKPPLLPGAFVKVLIAGKTLENAVAVPRDAIRGQNNVWLVNNGRLHVTELDVVRTDREFAYVTSGLPEGATIVTSALDAVVDGMTVRLLDETVPEASGSTAIPTGGTAGEE